MPSQQGLANLQKRLVAHRAILATLLTQQGTHAAANVPPAVVSGIHEAREEIRRIKAALRGWGVEVEDLLDDVLPAALPDAGTAPRRAALAEGQIPPGSSAISFGEGNQIGDVSIGDAAGRDVVKGNVEVSGTIYGPAIGVNYGPIISADQEAVEHRRLARYREDLAARMSLLPLPSIDDHMQIELSQVVVPLATETQIEVANGSAQDLRHYFEIEGPNQPLKQAHSPDYALPDQALYLHCDDADSRQSRMRLFRALSAAEALWQHQRMVLLGEPGSGKSLFLQHLAWVLAHHGQDTSQVTDLPGWNPQRPLLPILVPLQTLARRLARGGAGAETVFAVLHDELHVGQAQDALASLLARGEALALFDALDAVPAEARSDSADRHATLRAVRDFARRYAHCPMVLTCRTRAFAAPLRKALDWPVETLFPLTLGQVRSFVPAWYAALVTQGYIDQNRADYLRTTLIHSIVTSPRLSAMSRTPLLLTMMALVHAAHGELPHTMSQLYESILEQLLGQWEAVRAGQGLPGATADLQLDRGTIHTLLDRLAYVAHRAAAGEDGRGRLNRSAVRESLFSFFESTYPQEQWGDAYRYLIYFEQRSSLLVNDGSDGYRFRHLALQEYCAGRQIISAAADPIAQILTLRAERHWYEPLRLAAMRLKPRELNMLLTDLLDPDEPGKPKEHRRYYRDLILAAEISEDCDWETLQNEPMIRVARHKQSLRTGLVTLLADCEQPLPVAERVRAGFLLGDLGDPRFPLSAQEWRDAISHAGAGRADGYFCPIPLCPESPALWIGRYPITNAQLDEWLRTTALPPRRRALDANFNRPNQPATGVSWFLATDFCAWLSQQAGVTIRLPTEVEWQAAAYGSDGRLYPWEGRQHRDHAAIKEDRELREWLYTTPIGCYPAGASAIGALDMIGNVWEWTSDQAGSESASSGQRSEGQPRILRGGAIGASGIRSWRPSELPRHLGGK